MVKSTQIESADLLEIYKMLRNSIAKNDYATFCSLIEKTSQTIPKDDWNQETANFILETMPDPKNFTLVDVISKKDLTLLRFYQEVSVDENLYLYGAIFFKKETGKFKFSRLLIRNIESKKSSLKKDILAAFESDPDFSLFELKQKPKKEDSEPSALSLRNEYENGWTPYVVLTPPKGWFDICASGNSSYGGFETLVMGGIGFSETGEADYSTKKKMSFGICKSKSSLIDFSNALKEAKFSIKNLSKDGFEAFRKDDFWGNTYQLVKKIDSGFLVGLVSAESDSDFEFSKKALIEIFPKLKIKI